MSFCILALFFLPAQPAFPDAALSSPVDEFARHALAEWVLEGETLPARPAALAALLTDMPAAVRLAKSVTGLDYRLDAADTNAYVLTTPRGLTAQIRTVRLDLQPSGGHFEAVGEGVFERTGGGFRGRYAMKFTYRELPEGRSLGNFYVYIDVENPLLRFFGLFVRGLINQRLESEMRRMLDEARQVMREADRRLTPSGR
ncbi:hypothetical protein HY522_07525 [bacterium]|nr:hypothetical protein [bacterium]